MHVLVCEDDELIASGIKAGLTAQGLTVEHVSTAAAARAMLKAAEFDVMVLDLGLPDEDGLKLLQQLRQQLFSPEEQQRIDAALALRRLNAGSSGS